MTNNKRISEKVKHKKLNLGSGVNLLAGFVNVDAYLDLEGMIEGARTKQGIYKNAKIGKGAQFVKGHAANLPFADKTFEYIECCDMIEHLPIDQVVPALFEIRRVLKKGGQAVVMTIDFNWLCHAWLQMAQKPFDVKEYIHLATMAYGNQMGEGEYHRVPITPQMLAHCLVSAGWDLKREVDMRIHPVGTRHPKFKSGRGRGTVFINDALIVTLTKKS